ncbi:MAG: TRAP transporter small permease [Thermodesulfobacteriota bacterium]
MHASSEPGSMITRWTRVISLIGLFGLLVLAFITVFEVLLRWIFHKAIASVSDISILVITVAIASCFPLVFAQRGNITIRMVGSMLGPRVSMLLDAFGSLVGIGIFSLLTWQLWIYANNLALRNETTMMVLLPLAPWYRAATALLALCIPTQAIVFFDQVRSAVSGPVVPDREAIQKPGEEGG